MDASSLKRSSTTPAVVTHCAEGAIASGDPDEQRRKVAGLIDVLGRANR